MLFTNKNIKRNLLLSLLLILSLILFAACSSDSTTNETPDEHSDDHSMEEMEDGEHEMDHEHSEERIPNPDGAAITILSPEDGAAFASGEEVIVEVKVDNFALGEDDNHWHVYVDGSSWGMVMGGNTSQSLQGIEPGEHEVEVYLAGGDHIEFQDGGSIHITVE